MASQSSKRGKAVAANPLRAQDWNFHNDILTFCYGKKSRIRPASLWKGSAKGGKFSKM